MATINENRILSPIGEAPLISIAKATAVAGDASADEFDVIMEVPTGATIRTFAVDYRSSTGQEKSVIATISGNTVTIADGAVDVIATGDIAQITAYYDYN